MDHHVLLGLDRLIPDLNLCLNPFGENFFEDGVGNITEPLLVQLVDLLPIWHVLKDMLVAIFQKARDILQRQAVILGNLDMADILALDVWYLGDISTF